MKVTYRIDRRERVPVAVTLGRALGIGLVLKP
jgi:hypothetical protein